MDLEQRAIYTYYTHPPPSLPIKATNNTAVYQNRRFNTANILDRSLIQLIAQSSCIFYLFIYASLNDALSSSREGQISALDKVQKKAAKFAYNTKVRTGKNWRRVES